MMRYRKNKKSASLATPKVRKNRQFKFHESVKSAMIFGQFFGLFPISGLWNDTSDNINFKWKSVHTIFSLFFISFSVFATLSMLRFQFSLGPLTPSNIIGVLFYAFSSFFAISLFQISRKWNVIMHHISEVETIFLEDKYLLPPSKWTLKTRLLVLAWIFIFGVILEHTLFLSAKIVEFSYRRKKCQDHSEFFESFIIDHIYWFFKKVPFTYPLGFGMEYTNFSLTFYWGYTDIFLMLVSAMIAYRFEQVNDRMEYFRGRIIPDHVWYNLRQHYTKLGELTFFIDRQFGPVLVGACMCDAYFILMQLLNITNAVPFVINKIYFWFSLLFLIVKTTTLFLICSSIHENSKKPLIVFRSIPSMGWYQELERFSNQVQGENIALSGMNFYFMTKNVLFALAGTLLTYELVLLQFDPQDEVDIDKMITCD